MLLYGLGFLLAYFATRSRGLNCSVSPLLLPIQNTTFSDGIAVNRGVQTLLDGQLLGLRLSLSQNNTRVRNARDCSQIPANFSACQGASGGVFSISEDTFTTVPPSRWNVSVIDPHPDGTTITFGYGGAEFPGTPASISQLPVEVWADVNAANKSELPLGSSSSFLDRLVNSSWAPSRNFGLYYGSRSQNQPQDGHLIVGGVDLTRFNASTLVEFPIAGYGAPSRCQLQVMLADVILTNIDGNHSLFKDPDARVPACIDTIQNAFTFTKAMYNEWAQLTGHIDYDGSNYTVQTYPQDREPLIGSLTIKLSNGYTSVIPHFELLSSERGTDAQGKYSITNSSKIMAAVQTGKGDLGVDVPLLGGVFLSQNYLRVDYDQNKFWLAQAILDTTVPPSIQTICDFPLTSTNDGHENSSGDSTDIGLKAGLPIAFVVVACGLFGWWLFKRRHNSIISQPNEGWNRFRRTFSFSGKVQRQITSDFSDISPVSNTSRKVSELETIEKPVLIGHHHPDHVVRHNIRTPDAQVAELETSTAKPDFKPVT